MSIFNVQYGTLLDRQSKLDQLFENDNKKAIFYFIIRRLGFHPTQLLHHPCCDTE